MRAYDKIETQPFVTKTSKINSRIRTCKPPLYGLFMLYYFTPDELNPLSPRFLSSFSSFLMTPLTSSVFGISTMRICAIFVPAGMQTLLTPRHSTQHVFRRALQLHQHLNLLITPPCVRQVGLNPLAEYTRRILSNM